jgi:hypothetical protein
MKLQMQLWFLICFWGKSKLTSCKRDRVLLFISGLLTRRSWCSLFFFLTIGVHYLFSWQ